MRCEKQKETRLPRTFGTWYTAPLYQAFVMLIQPCSILQLTPNKLYLWILLVPEPQRYCSAGLECASTEGWTRVANLIWVSHTSSVQVNWTCKHTAQIRGGCVEVAAIRSSGCLSAMYNTYSKIITRQRCAIPIRPNCSFCVHKQTTTTYWQAEQSLYPCCVCAPTNVSFNAVLSRAMHTLSE